MIRLFSHYMRWYTLRGMLFDGGLMLVVCLGVVASQIGGLDLALPLAGGPVVSIAAGLLAVNGASGLYRTPHDVSFGRSAARAMVVLLVALPLGYVLFGMLPAGLANRELARLSIVGAMGALVVRRAYLAHRAAEASARTRILIFGVGEAAAEVSATLTRADPNARILGHVAGPNERTPAIPANKILAMPSSLPDLAYALEADEIVVALTERRAGSMPLRQLLDCKVSGIKVYDLNTHFEKTLGQIRTDYLNASWLIFGDGFNQGAWRTAVKRTFDIIAATLLLLLASPVMVITSILIKMESAGPVLYRQERVGLNGRNFSIAKFRSMRTDAEKDGTPRWAAAKDDRVTRVGHVIRRLRVDELPQLFNVLRGEMSLVGPRPERPFFVEQLTQELPFYALRHSVKPGVTGWAQVRYAYGATVEDSLQKLQYDLYYVKNHGLFLDLVVLLETVGVVLTGKGAR